MCLPMLESVGWQGAVFGEAIKGEVVGLQQVMDDAFSMNLGPLALEVLHTRPRVLMPIALDRSHPSAWAAVRRMRARSVRVNLRRPPRDGASCRLPNCHPGVGLFAMATGLGSHASACSRFQACRTAASTSAAPSATARWLLHSSPILSNPCAGTLRVAAAWCGMDQPA